MQTTEDKLKEIIAAGLVDGLGHPRPGELCLEAAICLALGEPHGDEPSCVHEADRRFSIVINDAEWSSPQERAEALLPLALAQLGTAGRDRSKWVKLLTENIIRRVVPIALRAAADVHHDQTHRDALRREATRCEEKGASEAAKSAYACAKSAYAAAYSVAYSAAYAANAAAYAAKSAASVAASAAASAAHAAYAAYAHAPHADAHKQDEVLRVAVQCALDAYAEE